MNKAASPHVDPDGQPSPVAPAEPAPASAHQENIEMRILLFAAALSISGIAVAQTSQPSGQTVDDPSQATGPQGITQQGTDPEGRAMAPAGTDQIPQEANADRVPMAGQGGPFEPRAAAGDYPPCSRTVTDSCIQTYERGVRRAPRR
jgi:hypothetical protein